AARHDARPDHRPHLARADPAGRRAVPHRGDRPAAAARRARASARRHQAPGARAHPHLHRRLALAAGVARGRLPRGRRHRAVRHGAALGAHGRTTGLPQRAPRHREPRRRRTRPGGPERGPPAMTGALLLTGGGELHDPWHPFPATSRRIAALLEADQVPTTIVDTVGALGDAVDGARLLVINAGSGIGPTPHDDALLAIVETHLAAGRGLLAVHATAGLLPGSRAWERALGGCWVPGVSDHPSLGDTRVLLGGHELVDGLDEVHVVDERYTGLRVAPDA